MTVVFESKRLLFRLFSIDDAKQVYTLNKDPEVTRYTHDPMSSIEQAREVLEQTILPQYAVYNHGRWAVHLKTDLSFMGWCGLKYRPELDEVDLGYRFKKEYWGKGYATEAAFASLKYGFEKLDLQRITGRAEPENQASLAVLEKCGMIFIGNQLVDGHEALTYELLNPSIR
jgi:ribosomal-protein-alanine N-acetyltransferase